MTTEAEVLLERLGAIIASGKPAEYRLENLILNACAVRSYTLVKNYIGRHGEKVYGGPLQGMLLPLDVVTPFLLSRYIGSYEYELHDAIRAAAEAGYDSILNIGCAEGYYAVGLARLISGAEVYAYDILPEAREKCRRLAEVNGVAARMHIGQAFSQGDFERFVDRRTLLFCDIEGAEFGLLDPVAAPALAGMDIIVEVHETERTPSRDDLCRRFEATHDIVRIDAGRGYSGPLPDWIENGMEFNMLLASHCFREKPTPWAWMRSHTARH